MSTIHAVGPMIRNRRNLKVIATALICVVWAAATAQAHSSLATQAKVIAGP